MDIFVAITLPEMYRTLVLERGWSDDPMTSTSPQAVPDGGCASSSHPYLHGAMRQRNSAKQSVSPPKAPANRCLR